ncbi:hypothetical protein MD588_24870 [Photobacterium sp. SDRW27]|uniref:hypothetical protein n=1 Tax=Photobacterium obscurum TaxID=2829490 RepID=UPI002243C082|nr:hypothetical protein [Photobacterium obscurum]MCW8332029.1 hypothetical protein [Photobacterium obscurum]
MARLFYTSDAILDDPVQQVAREAHRIVMNYPHQGKLDDKHVLALRSIELNIISEPNGVKFNDKFRVKLQSALPTGALLP